MRRIICKCCATIPRKLDLLAKDLLINVTCFFRDPKVFDFLGEEVLPGLIRDHPADQPLRIWVAGCSTGEETYSLAMLFREAMEAAGKTIKLQVLASDIDADAVAQAREGLYPASIDAEVSPERLARFFVKEERGYRVVPDLRDNVVFTVQDLLADPPFSRLDFVSCRNLLIYLGHEAQAKVMDIFHFALREGGILLLGGAETVGETHGRFTAISKTERIFRHTARGRPGDFGFLGGDGARLPARLEQGSTSRRKSLADLCQRLLLESLAPAAVLINRNNECLYSTGPTDLYLSIAPGQATQDLLAMARKGLGGRLRSAIQRAFERMRRHPSASARLDHEGGRPVAFPCGRSSATARTWLWSALPRTRGRSGGKVAKPALPTIRWSRNWNANWRRRGPNCRTPFAISRSRARSTRRSTRRPCR